MKTTPSAIQEVLSLLTETPRQLNSSITEFNETHLFSPAGQKSMSISEILAHLRSCADIWTFSIYAMLTEEKPILPEINDRKWAKMTAYARLPLALSLQAFTFQREELMRVLRPLPLEGWERGMLSTENENTVFSQAKRMALHEQNHIEQMAKFLKQLK